MCGRPPSALRWMDASVAARAWESLKGCCAASQYAYRLAGRMGAREGADRQGVCGGMQASCGGPCGCVAATVGYGPLPCLATWPLYLPGSQW